MERSICCSLRSRSNAGDPPGALLWLGNGAQKFTPLAQPVGPARVFDVADVNGDGRLDLLGLSAAGQAQQALNQGSKTYQWQILRPRARQATGDQRINSFGIGGEMELRSGLMLQKQPITAPQLHFGLGEQGGADVVRILWPNGMENAEFALKADQEVLTEQRLKGSCPFLFAWNGKQIGFVKDAVPWGSAIGLQIDSVGSPKIAATEEWYKIGRDQLVPHDGYYDLRHHRRAMGDLLLRLPEVDGGRPSGRHRDFYRRAVCRSTGQAGNHRPSRLRTPLPKPSMIEAPM